MEAQHLSMDIISTLPQPLIETILCFLPIQEAARTSILSKDWRYRWINIPKLLFNEHNFEASSDENQLSVLEQTFENPPSQRKNMTKRCQFFYAIYQVLLMHQGPILEFTLSMRADDTCVEIDHIIFHLSRNNTVNKLSLNLRCDYRLPLSVFSLHRLTDLELQNCILDHQPTFSGFGSLTSLYLCAVIISKKMLLRLISRSPLLKSFTLRMDETCILGNDDSTIIELFEFLPMVEHLTIWYWAIECFVQDAVPCELPTSLVHLKYFFLDDMCFVDKYGLPFLVLMIRSSPKLEKIKLQIYPHYAVCCEKSEIESVSLENYSDIWLEHLKELEIEYFCNSKPELEFVKLILAKSPMLKKVRIVLYDVVDKDEELFSIILRTTSHASPVVEFVVEQIPDDEDVVEQIPDDED